MDCYEAIDVMDLALDGTLAADLRAGLDGHLAECRPCRVYMEQLIVTRRALEALPATEETSPRRDALLDAYRKAFEEGK